MKLTRWRSEFGTVFVVVCSLLLSACQQLPQRFTAGAPLQPAQHFNAEIQHPKNIILMIGDGMGPSHISALRYFLDDLSTEIVEPLPIDRYLVGSLRTSPYGKKGDVTDSAASATSYATGRKTINGAISTDPKGKALPTVLEWAKRRGLSTGLVATSQINHATPAAFASHVTSRKQYDEIARQLLQNPVTGAPVVDVLLGGGYDYFSKPNTNLIQQFESLGYQFARDREALNALNGNRLLGLFAPIGLPFAIDRDTSTPSLSDMSGKALATLSRNPQGFFLMIEGSEIDWAAHDNDVVGVISEMQDFLAAIRKVEAWVTENPDTLVLITADHATGGLSVGRQVGDKNYYQLNPDVIAGFRRSAAWIVENATATGNLLDSFQAASDYVLSEAQQQSLKQASVAAKEANLKLVTDLIAEITLTGWTTRGHTGVDVNLYAFGAGAEQFRGHHDNTYIGQMLFQLLGKSEE